MTSAAQIDALLAETGALLELPEVLGFSEENCWTLRIDENTLLFVDHEAGRPFVTLSGEVAAVRPAARAQVHELLLVYNGQWKTTGGLRMALDGPDGAVIQLCELPVADLDARSFAGALRVFTDVLLGWREMLGRDPAGSAGTSDLYQESQGFIRG